MRHEIWLFLGPEGEPRACGLNEAQALGAYWKQMKGSTSVVNMKYTHGIQYFAMSPTAKADGWTLKKVEVEG